MDERRVPRRSEGAHWQTQEAVMKQNRKRKSEEEDISLSKRFKGGEENMLQPGTQTQMSVRIDDIRSLEQSRQQTSSSTVQEILSCALICLPPALITLHLSLLPNNLKWDHELQFSRPNFKQLIQYLKATNEEFGKNNLDKDAFPNAYELTQLSLKVYQKKETNETHDAYERRLNLPSGWKLLTTAAHFDTVLEKISLQFNGYYGAAFVNLSKRHIVVAHRGTVLSDLGALAADLDGIVLGEFTPRMSSAVTFADHVVNALAGVKGVGLTFTGHSLGGWLAQITNFTSMYLHRDESLFIKNNPRQGIHSHTVAFDSPGCYEMLLKIKENYEDNRQYSMSLEKLDITSFLSAPNKFNTLNEHCGTVFTIFPEFDELLFEISYNIGVHNINSIAELFLQETGDIARDQNGKCMMKKVKRWPGRENYEIFKEWANRSGFIKSLNDYNKHMKVEKQASDDGRLPYETVDYNETYCSLNVFSPEESKLLKHWFAMKRANNELEKLKQFTSRYMLDDFKKLLPDFKISKDKIFCSSKSALSSLINRTKQLMRWKSFELSCAVNEQLNLIRSIDSNSVQSNSNIRN